MYVLTGQMATVLVTREGYSIGCAEGTWPAFANSPAGARESGAGEGSHRAHFAVAISLAAVVFAFTRLDGFPDIRCEQAALCSSCVLVLHYAARYID